MALIRYLLYFAGIAFFTWLFTWLEIRSPGSLRLHVLVNPGDLHGTSEFSPVELIQPLILAICGVLCGWVARDFPAQRPVAFLFGGLALIFMIRELDYFLDNYVADNLWQTLAVVAASLLIVYTYRHRRRFRVAWLRLWPSPGLTLLFAGAVVHFVYVRFIGHEPLWLAILGDDYQRVVKLAVEEFFELMGYFFWLVGTLEYVFQARAISTREPQPAAVRRRGGQRQKSVSGRY
ncbi:MAG: hypothetical protein OEY08_12815 [Gammaproteobacteria bacterium]|nr:hypothetical protein [Gammaproteobacteria bacterium]